MVSIVLSEVFCFVKSYFLPPFYTFSLTKRKKEKYSLVLCGRKDDYVVNSTLKLLHLNIKKATWLGGFFREIIMKKKSLGFH